MFKQLFFLSLLAASTSAFVAPSQTVRSHATCYHRNIMSATNDNKEDDQPTKMPDMPDFNVNDLLSKVPEINFDLKNFDVETIKNNLMDGTFGERGEVYAAAQFALLACIVGGGIPFIGGALMVLLGPCLMLAGAATVFLSVKDLGNNLSPWSVPPSGGDLVQDGIYAQLRHPQYAGLAAFSGGFSILTGSASSLLLTGVLFYVFTLVAEKEEVELSKTYPKYSKYSNTVVGRFFPEEIVKQLPWN